MKSYIVATPFLLAYILLIIMKLIICYVVSVRLGHVYPVLPFISETGNYPPESCIFTLMLNVCSLFMLVCVWGRSQQVENYVSQLKPGGQHLDILATNKIGYLIGIFTAVNLFGVANFQDVNLLRIHIITALSFFVGSALYMHFQYSISRRTRLSTPFLTELRGRQAQLQALMVLLTISLASVAMSQLNGKKLRDVTPADNGYLSHTLSAICEYTAVLNLAAFILTFHKEALHLAIQLPEVYLDDDGHRVQDRPAEQHNLKTPSMLHVKQCHWN